MTDMKTIRRVNAAHAAEISAKDHRIRELEAALAAEKANAARGWELFQTFRRKYAELKHPGMTGEIKLMDGAALRVPTPKEISRDPTRIS